MGMKPITTKSTLRPPQDCTTMCVLLIESAEYNRMFCRVFTTYGGLFDHLHNRIRAIDPTVPQRAELKHKVVDFEQFEQRVRDGLATSRETYYIFDNIPVNT